MKHGIIITSFIEGDMKKLKKQYIDTKPDRCVICADGGLAYALRCGLRPDILIGDMDSLPADVPIPDDIEALHVPIEKDDTDTGLCLSYAIRQGFRDITVLGGIGGRLDHTVANMQSLTAAAEQGVRLWFADENNQMTAVKNGSVTIPAQAGAKFGVFSMTEQAEGVYIKGAHYPLNNALLKNTYPIGVSNAFESEQATIQVRNGILLIIVTRLK